MAGNLGFAAREPVWITGGGGFVGSHLVRRLIESGAGVTLLTSKRFRGDRLAGQLNALRLHPADRVPELLARQRPEVVYHLASTPFQPADRPASEHAEVIFGGTFGLLEALRKAPPKRFVFAGSAAEYGDGEVLDGKALREDTECRPATVLGAMKFAASALVESYGRMLGMETVIARLFTPFGPFESPSRLVPYAIGSAMRAEAVRLRGDGSQERDFIYVEDAAEALAALGFQSLEGRSVFNISSGQATTARGMAERVISMMGNPVPVECGSGAARSDEIRKCRGDSTLARRVLGWRPRGLDEGIQKTIRWFRENSQWLQWQGN